MDSIPAAPLGSLKRMTLYRLLSQRNITKPGALYMGFDLSTQQLKGLVVNSNLKLIHEAKVDFDADFGKKYGLNKGVLTNPAEGEVFAPPALWLEAINLVLDRLEEDGLDFSRVQGMSGAGMQHGTVFWSEKAEKLMAKLDYRKSLVEQLAPGDKDEIRGAFAHPMSPNWQDASTQKQCDEFDAIMGNSHVLAYATGSKAHHRFSGPQIMRYRTKYPEHYEKTSRISLVSSFVASILLGKFAPIDISDVTGMNLWEINKNNWDNILLQLAAGSKAGVPELKRKLGGVPGDGGAILGDIAPYFQRRYGFPSDCKVIAWTGDNPSTILSLPLRQGDAMVSLGTSTTFLMSTDQYKPDPAFHFMNHPTTPNLYMFMLCYKNGGLAREQVRDHFKSKTWDEFNEVALSTNEASQKSESDDMRLGLYFPRPEIVPNIHSGQWRYNYNPATKKLKELSSDFVPDDARNIVESQMLSLRLRSQALVKPEKDAETGKDLLPQPRRVYLVGGGSANPAIAKICGEVLGSVEGVYKLDIGGNACALGSAYKAVWACERKEGQTFDDLIGGRWDESSFVRKVAEGYKPGTFERYGKAVEGFEAMEKLLLEREGELVGQRTGGRVFGDGKHD